ncbi:MAG TPA: histidine kinase [Candidatus Dormibacteraeota bacterium]
MIAWSTQQLAEFLAAVSSSATEASAALTAVERAAETLDAQMAAIVCGDELVASVGYPEGAAPAADIAAAVESGLLHVPGAGACRAAAVSIEHPPGAMFVVARSGAAGLSREEASLLRSMGRVTSLTMRMLHLLDDERAARAELMASRARIVTAADETRRRIERDLHDGIQQRLVTLALQLQAMADALPAEQRGALQAVAQVNEGLTEVLEELREISRGVHPAVLSEGGIVPAIRALVRRAALPVELDVGKVERLRQPVEAAVYYVVSEALTNAAKHAHASAAHVKLEARAGVLRLEVSDDGVGGANPSHGSGLIGLSDRVAALGGTLTITSAPGAGTSMTVAVPMRLG